MNEIEQTPPPVNLTITQIVKNNRANFDFYRLGLVYYKVNVDGQNYSFPINLKEIEGASLFASEKAITLMKHINKALKDGTFVKTT